MSRWHCFLLTLGFVRNQGGSGIIQAIVDPNFSPYPHHPPVFLWEALRAICSSQSRKCVLFSPKKMWVMLCIAVIVASFAYLQPWKQCRAQVTHQDSWHGVLILAVQVTETIVRNDNACQFAIHSKMRIGITHKDQEMEGIIPPANLFLQWERNIWVMWDRGRHLLRVDQLWLDTFRLQKLYCRSICFGLFHLLWVDDY